jgi:hypothetical protein
MYNEVTVAPPARRADISARMSAVAERATTFCERVNGSILSKASA